MSEREHVYQDKKRYVNPKFSVITLNKIDVIMTSGIDDGTEGLGGFSGIYDDVSWR